MTSTGESPWSDGREGASTSDGEPTVVVGESSRAGPPAKEAVPARLGRYVVVSEIGAGGMGRVLRAYDPKLRREVALKLLTTGAHRSEAAARMVREAQAMARLSHPNVVPVYDVEQDGDEVFIAMEFVDGDTLRRWLGRAQRSWREVMAVFVFAGRGLAAAHAAGVVHRDFKPSNVMIGTAPGDAPESSRPLPVTNVRVMDFGLARGVEANAGDADGSAFQTAGDASSDLTEAGTILGTPAYMAPEQHDGGVVAAASDQYAFCVALYEALYGVRPFAGTSLEELRAAKRRGVPEAPQRGGNVPRWLHAAVLRGLAFDPEQRWPTMDALLAELERGQARRRQRLVFASVAAVVLAGATPVVVHQLDVRAKTAACEQAGAEVETSWNDGTRARLREAFVATGVGYAETAADRVMPWLDAQAATLRSASVEACLDARVRGTLTEDMHERSTWCIDERRTELDALVGELTKADRSVVQKSVSAAAGLPSVDDCRSSALLERMPPPPSDRASEIRELRVQVSRAGALDAAGKFAEGVAVATAAREQADAIGWPPLAASARLREALLLEHAGDHAAAERLLTQAYFEAARVGAWSIAADAATAQIFDVGYRAARVAEGLSWGDHAALALAYSGDPGGVREARRLRNIGVVRDSAGEHAAARELHERSLALRIEALGPTHPEVATSLVSLANVASQTSDFGAAKALHERALAIYEDALGPDHPSVATSLNNLANIHVYLGDHAQARALHERALAIRERSLDPNHPDLAATLNNLCGILAYLGDSEGALPKCERGLAIREQALGADHPDVASSLTNLAHANIGLRRLDEARAQLERALAIMEKRLGPDHRDLATTLINLASLAAEAGDRAAQIELLERSLAIRERALGPDHADVAVCLASLATARQASGEAASALPLLERAVKIFEQHDGVQPHELAVRFELAKALVDAGRDHERARALVQGVRDGWRSAGARDAQALAEVEQWLATVAAP